MRKIWIVLLAICICVIGVFAATTTTINKPTAYSTVTSTDVNLSVTNTQTGNSQNEVLNVTVWNRTSSSGTWVYLDDTLVTNNTFNTTWTVSLDDDERYWLRYTINYSAGIETTSERIIDVDVNYKDVIVNYNLNLSGYNLYVGGCIKYNCTTATASGCVTIGGCA